MAATTWMCRRNWSPRSPSANWPGNVRELRNAADRFVLGLDRGRSGRPRRSASGLADKVADFERGVIASALAAHGGSLRPVYEPLGISRKTLYEKMQKYGLDKKMRRLMSRE